MIPSDDIKTRLIDKILELTSDLDLTEACEKVGLDIETAVQHAIEQHLATKTAAELVDLL